MGKTILMTALGGLLGLLFAQALVWALGAATGTLVQPLAHLTITMILMLCGAALMGGAEAERQIASPSYYS